MRQSQLCGDVEKLVVAVIGVLGALRLDFKAYIENTTPQTPGPGQARHVFLRLLNLTIPTVCSCNWQENPRTAS